MDEMHAIHHVTHHAGKEFPLGEREQFFVRIPWLHCISCSLQRNREHTRRAVRLSSRYQADG